MDSVSLSPPHPSSYAPAQIPFVFWEAAGTNPYLLQEACSILSQPLLSLPAPVIVFPVKKEAQRAQFFLPLLNFFLAGKTIADPAKES